MKQEYISHNQGISNNC